MSEQTASNAGTNINGPVSVGLPAGESFAIWQLAKLLCCHRQHLINLVESGEIKCAIDLRGKGSSRSTIRIPRAALLEFLEKRQVIAAIGNAKKHPRKN